MDGRLNRSPGENVGITGFTLALVAARQSVVKHRLTQSVGNAVLNKPGVLDPKE
jgi:hypothetical protein